MEKTKSDEVNLFPKPPKKKEDEWSNEKPSASKDWMGPQYGNNFLGLFNRVQVIKQRKKNQNQLKRKALRKPRAMKGISRKAKMELKDPELNRARSWLARGLPGRKKTRKKYLKVSFDTGNHGRTSQMS